MSLAQELVKKGIIGEKKASSLEYKAKSKDKKVEEVILENGVISEKKLFEIKSRLIDIPLKKVYPEDVDLDLLKLVPGKTAGHYKVVPLGFQGDVLELGMVYPEDEKAKDAINFLARQGGFEYKIYLITPTNFKEIYKKYRGLKKEVSEALEEAQKREREEKEKKSPKKETKGKLERLTEKTPISKVIDVLLRHALEGSASDIHIEPFGSKLRVRFRVLGDLHSSIFLPENYLSTLVARVKILSDLRIDESRIPQDGRFSKEIDGRKIDFRVSTFPTAKGEKVALRILDPKEGLKSFDDLGLSERGYQKLKKSVEQPAGMILVSGPTGSGKTTTLYALLQHLNKDEVNIVTLEDPIEYFLPGLNQSQIKPEIGYTFAKGLRFVLRQDPDIIMVGELRDEESAILAAHAALVGDLLLATIHTTNVLNVPTRLINLGVKPYLVPVTVSTMLSQRLVRKLCDNCKKKTKPNKEEEEIVKKELDGLPEDIKKKIDLDGFDIWKEQGCRECEQRGFSGRVGVFEVLNMTEPLSEVIMSGDLSEFKIAEEAERQKMVTMRQDAFLKVLKGETTIKEALSVVREK